MISLADVPSLFKMIDGVCEKHSVRTAWAEYGPRQAKCRLYAASS
jgi:hypothetical protein